MGTHLTETGEFQSDKYPACPAGKVPLSTGDGDAQDLLWEYAERHEARDAAFSEDLRTALKSKGYVTDSVGLIYVKALVLACALTEDGSEEEKTLDRLIEEASLKNGFDSETMFDLVCAEHPIVGRHLKQKA